MRARLLAVALSASALLLTTFGAAVPASAASYKVTARSSVNSPVVDQKVTIYGTVLPAKDNAKVSVQAVTNGKWQTVTKTETARDGQYSARLTFKTSGVKKLRVLRDATKSSPAASSPILRLIVRSSGTMWEWVPLTESRIERGHDFYDAGLEKTDGSSTFRTLQAAQSSTTKEGDVEYAEFDLDERCISFMARVGIDDDSWSRARQRLEIYVDGDREYSEKMGLGDADNVTLTITKANRLRISTTKLSDSERGSTTYSNFGDAQVLCRV
ncbi:MAG: NPCBM/NEW2 domain-containing protein [Candidatus Nanopelagicales bacterium]